MGGGRKKEGRGKTAFLRRQWGKGRNERMRRESARENGGRERRREREREGWKSWNNASESDAESVEQRSLNAINRRAIQFSSLRGAR